MENCADRYYSKVIETFTLLLKRRFANRQLLLINTTRSLKFLEEYVDKQAIIWKIFSKHQTIPDDISDLHLHIDDFKGNIHKEFNFLKEATCRNIKNFQASLRSQKTYSVALGSHINNIYHKISKLQQLPHSTQHMNTGDIIQINAPEFDPYIDGGPTMKEHGKIQESDNPIQHCVGETKKSEAPALPQQVEEEVDWPDTVPVKIPPQSAQDNDYNILVVSTWPKTNYSEIPQLESDIDEEEEGQFEDIQTYLYNHNIYQEIQNIHKVYTKRLLDLDDERYYRDIDHMYETYSQDRAHIPVIQTPAPYHITQELIQTYSRGRVQAHREQLHGHRPFGARTQSLQSRIQREIKKTQRMRQRYVNTQ